MAATIIKTNITPHIFHGPWKGTYTISGITESELDAALASKVNSISIGTIFFGAPVLQYE